MQEMQLTEDEACIQGVSRVRADIHDVQALIDQVSYGHELRQNHARRIGQLG